MTPRPLIVLLAGLALAGPVAAQVPDPAEGGGHGPRQHLFISPMGEPFRGPNGLEAWFMGADADHDGGLTRQEFRDDARRWFRLLDANGDGLLDPYDIQAYEQEKAPEITRFGFDEPLGEGREGRRRGSGREGPDAHGKGAPRFRPAGSDGAARYSLLDIPEPVASADADVDGRVTLAEWDAAADRRFDMLDRAHAGRLTQAGLLASPGRR